MSEDVLLVLVAAGSSSRMKTGIKKEWLPLGEGTVLSESLKAFLLSVKPKAVAIAVNEGGKEDARRSLAADASVESLLRGIPLFFCTGGKDRQQSALLSLRALDQANAQCGGSLFGEDAVVLVHDAARPFVPKETILRVLKAAGSYGAAIPAIAAVDTQKQITGDGFVAHHLERRTIAASQTPQGFHFRTLLERHERAATSARRFTDDSEVWDTFADATDERRVRVVQGDERNKKITFQSDIPATQGQLRVGFGEDLHRLVSGRKLLLGGVEIPSQKGEEAHSDGDVLLHAVCDALLGAASMGDIGDHFSDTSEKWRGADSKELLRVVYNEVRVEGFALVNLDCVVHLELPKLASYKERIRDSVAQLLGVSPAQVAVKAKTREGLGDIGRGEAISARCVCLLERRG